MSAASGSCCWVTAAGLRRRHGGNLRCRRAFRRCASRSRAAAMSGPPISSSIVRVAAWVFPRSDLTQRDPPPWRQQTWSVETARRAPAAPRPLRRADGRTRRTAAARDACASSRCPKACRTITRRRWYSPMARWRCSSRSSIASRWTRCAAVRALPSDLNNQLVPAAKLTYVFRDRRGPGAARRQAQRRRRDRRQGHLRVLRRRRSPVETPDMIGYPRSAVAGVDPGSLDAAPCPHYLARYTQELGALRRVQAHDHGELGGPDAGHLVARGQRAARPHRHALRRRGHARRKPSKQRASRACGSSRTRPRISGWGRPSATNTRAMPGSPKAAPTCSPSALRALKPIPIRPARSTSIEPSRTAWISRTARRRERARARRAPRLLRLRRGVRAGGRRRVRQVLLQVRAQLIDANRADGVVTRAEWLAALDAASREARPGPRHRAAARPGRPDPDGIHYRVVARAGVNIEHRRAGHAALR